MTTSVLTDDMLTDRQLRFVYEYLQDHNASAAAVRAGYSEKSRASAAHDLMKNPAVQARLREEMASLLGELRCSALELMKERVRAAFFRPGRMLKGNWEMRDLEEMEPEVLGSLEVRSVMRKSGPVLHVKQPDRDKALRALERVHERLDRLNEKYWDRLEKEDRLRGLAEIEAEADGEAEAHEAAMSVAENAEKTMVFLGSAVPGAPAVAALPAGAGSGAGDFFAKTKVFSGSEAGLPLPGNQIPEKTGVFYGGRGIAAPPDRARVRTVPEACAA